MPSILIVEDEREIAELIKFILIKEGFETVDIASTYAEANTMINRPYDTYLLDINLGDGSGYDLGNTIRKHTDAPILYVSANTQDRDKIKGFQNGADDYITKPFNPMELAARVKVNMDRYLKTGHRIGALYHFDEHNAELVVGKARYLLSGKQYLLMQYLYEHQDVLCTKEQIYEAVWENQFVDDNTVMVHIRKLREKLEENPSQPKLLVTVRGVGYILRSGVNQ
ncbi:response regulator transcription factor [Macrococcoides caseolyticum]|uniref:response regulator transcription factor n=1 Tax=Macrococcoides caseolyticum TaxID=69966 RepID=UPI001F3C4CED|nr:response regulator transcription factor [Macrococcus caseolyticus]MCE4957564.1 response regulator transcription factor [Macrococcus caseolyticus]